VVHEAAGERVWWLCEPADPFVEAMRLAVEAGIPVHFVDGDVDRVPPAAERLPDAYAAMRIGHRAFMEELYRRLPFPPSPSDRLRECAMAHRLAEAAGPGETVLFLCGAAHLHRVAEELPRAGGVLPLSRTRREGVALYHLDAPCLGETASELPFVQAVYEMRRGTLPSPPDPEARTVRRRAGILELLSGPGPAGIRRDEREALDDAVRYAAAHNGAQGEPLDRFRALVHLGRLSAVHYGQETGERIAPWQSRALFRFLRNWARLEGRLLPDLYQLVEGARGVGDDNYAWALLRLAARTPWQEGEAEIPTVSIGAEELRLGSRRLVIRRRVPTRRPRRLRLPARKEEGRPGEWAEGFLGRDGALRLCSWPPESLTLEAFGNFLRKRAARGAAEEAARVEPFRGSMLDGVDVRETARRAATGELWVRDLGRAPGAAGNVVVVFDEDEGGERHPWRMTWLGEHWQESDEALYATPPLDNVVGPGICRVEYGGFFLCFPPGRLDDVWGDPAFDFARTPAERLLAAAVDYSLEKNVVYVAPRPPRPLLRQYAARKGRRIVYVPLGSLSPGKVRKLRVIHILSGTERRKTAKDYIW
jgi:hypothetical protein